MSTEKYRYPGINYFTEADVDIFCGRDTDVQKLYTEIVLSDTMVLHADSGVGKSSLVRAGLIHYVIEQDVTFLPVIVNFGRFKKESNETDSSPDSEKENFLLNILRSTIKEKLNDINKEEKKSNGLLDRIKNNFKDQDQDDLPYLSPKEDNLWYLLKQIERKGHKLLLIFDQFEEFQDYNRNQQVCIAKALSQLYESRIPPLFNKEIDENLDKLFSREMSKEEQQKYNVNLEFLERTLLLKTLFVIREDKLGVMNLLSDYFPNILKNEFQLKPLTREQAKRAIVEPAALKKSYLLSPRFSFAEDAVKSLLDKLEEEKTDFIDPIQLQIVASNIEKNVKGKNKVISKTQVPNVKRVITSFYKNKWNVVKSKSTLKNAEFYEARKRILNKLIVSGNRNLVHEESLKQIPNGLKIADLLRTEGIVKVEHKNGGKFYCLSHDRMLRPAVNDIKKIKIDNENKKRTEKKIRNISFVFGLLLIGLIIGAIFLKKEYDYKRHKYSIKKGEIQSKELEFAKDSVRLITIDSITRMNNDKIDATIAKVEKSNIPNMEKNESIKSLENLKSPTTIIRYYKRKADGEMVTIALKALDTTEYQSNINESSEISESSSKVNTVYSGENVPEERVTQLIKLLNENGVIITNRKPFKGLDGYEWKNSAIEIVHEANDDKKEYHIRMYAYHPNDSIKSILNNFLGEYYQLKVYPDWKKKPSFFSSTSTVLYYSERTENEVINLTTSLSQLLGSKNVEFVYRRGHGLGVSESDRENTFIIHYVGD